MAVIDSATERTKPENQNLFHIVSYVQFPTAVRKCNAVVLDEPQLSVLPTVLYGRENRQVSALIFSVKAPSKSSATSLALRMNMWICRLLTVATGFLFETFYVQWRKRETPVDSVVNVVPEIKNAAVFPLGRWKDYKVESDQRFGERLSRVLGMFARLPSGVQNRVRSSVYAYCVPSEERKLRRKRDLFNPRSVTTA
jgi:hypothetical protein